MKKSTSSSILLMLFEYVYKKFLCVLLNVKPPLFDHLTMFLKASNFRWLISGMFSKSPKITSLILENLILCPYSEDIDSICLSNVSPFNPVEASSAAWVTPLRCFLVSDTLLPTT